MLPLLIIMMKNFAKLMLFYSLTFVALFLAAFLLVYLSSWLSMLRSFPTEALELENTAEISWRTLPALLYFSILLTLSYTARKKMPVAFAMIGILIMGSVFAVGISLGLSRTEAIRPIFRPVSFTHSESGLIFSRSDIDIVLLGENSDARGPRLVSMPGQPLTYQQVPMGPNNTILSLPELPFGADSSLFFQSIATDFSLSARELKSRFDESFISFAIYVLSLILFLASLRPIIGPTQWPLANLFIGAFVFRLILTMETFLNAREINALLAYSMGERFPPAAITPLIFCIMSALIILYSFLAHLARPRKNIDG